MSKERPANFAWCCAVTTLISALLLFLVQPIISKLILPWYGGSPAVWTTCLLFFQTLLLAGYAYAHLLVSYLSLGWQMRVHGAIVLLAAITLPITPSEVWEPTPTAEPVSSILLLLSFSIGLPFFALSATGPLVQSWFGNVYPGVPPYRLYALSNIGSLASLWLFPLLMEPNLTSTQQDWVWSTGFGLYLLSIFVIAVVFERDATSVDKVIYPEKPSIGDKPRWYDMALWIGLPALASVLLAAITSHICQDMAVVPPLLILPLSLYLLTFILAFDSPRWYIRPLWGWLAIWSLVGVAVIMMDDKVQSALEETKWIDYKAWKLDITDYTENAEFQIAIFMLALFSIAMICHGETTRRKPHTQHLTLFYLMISAGGALGSALVAIVCPLIFRRYDELNIALVLGFLVAAAVIITAVQYSKIKPVIKYTFSVVSALLLSGGLALLLTAQVRSLRTDYDTQMRNFYGVASVRTYKNTKGKPYGRVLYNGQINHGFQFLDGPRRYVPNSYYAPGSGVHVAIDSLRNGPQSSLKVGVIGLGTGTLAANGLKGDEFRFYEIDEKIVKICNEYFTYLKDTPAKVDVVLGDARLSLAHELKQGDSQKFDVLVIDAFSGDAIPVHLLTLESMKLYAQHMSERGVIAVHVSNRHLDLIPVVMRLADEMKAKAVLIENGGGDGADEASSDWVLVTNNREVLDYEHVVADGTVMEFKGRNLSPAERQVLSSLNKVDQSKVLAMDADAQANFFKLKPAERADALKNRSKGYNVYADGPLWTDKYSNVWGILK